MSHGKPASVSAKRWMKENDILLIRDDIKSEENLLGDEFYLRDVYESRLYKKQTFSDIRNILKKDGVNIKKVYLSNSVL